MKTIPALSLALLLLSGCAAQHYEMPAHDVLTQCQIEERYSIDRAWWKQYADPKLDSLVETALERNIDTVVRFRYGNVRGFGNINFPAF